MLFLEVKELIINYYRKFEKIVLPIGKFLFSLIVLLKLNSFLGGFNNHTALPNKFIITLAISVLSVFIPGNWFVLVLIAVICAQLLTVSMEATLLLALAMLVLYLLFVRIFPQMAKFAIIVPLLFSFKLGYLTPLIAGLFFGPVALSAIGVGVVVYRFSAYLPGLLDVKSDSLYDLPQTVMSMYEYITNVLTHDSPMMLMLLVFAIVLGVTYIVSRFEHDYIWYIAIGMGSMVNILGFIIGSIVLKADISIVGILIGTILAAGLTALAQFMRFSLDYQRAEKVQFEDDDYYYFVKALPKIKIPKQQKAIRKIR